MAGVNIGHRNPRCGESELKNNRGNERDMAEIRVVYDEGDYEDRNAATEIVADIKHKTGRDATIMRSGMLAEVG